MNSRGSIEFTLGVPTKDAFLDAILSVSNNSRHVLRVSNIARTGAYLVETVLFGYPVHGGMSEHLATAPCPALQVPTVDPDQLFGL